MTTEQRKCVFCDKTVYVKVNGHAYILKDCYCAVDATYEIQNNLEDLLNALSHPRKRELFPLISGYIREMTDTNQSVSLTVEELENIQNSPILPISIEDKCQKLLQYLYRHSKSPNEPVVIQQLTNSYNLTYSPNLQEFIYVLEKLKTDMLLERSGSSIKLTEKGRSAAIASIETKRLKPCFVAIAMDEDLRNLWRTKVMPNIEQFGYYPRITDRESSTKAEDQMMNFIQESEVVIAELTLHSSEVYFAAGHALGREIPVIWTVRSDELDRIAISLDEIHPIVWETPEELVMLLQQRLTK